MVHPLRLGQEIAQWQERLSSAAPAEILSWAHRQFGNRVVFATALGLEDQVITHFLAQNRPTIRIVTLDTGRLFAETHELIEKTEGRYNLKIETFFPETEEVESMVRQHGINLFYRSIELRQLCCRIRKIHPLQRALEGMQAWICGLRRQQSVTRRAVLPIEWDDTNRLVKINPVWNWEESQLWAVVKGNQVPYSPLHNQGFVSIGCACCTRAVRPGEDLRAGRWWWERPEHKECGLHSRRNP
jgi:phosphoadenosine phosphosulfate reductase